MRRGVFVAPPGTSEWVTHHNSSAAGRMYAAVFDGSP